MSSEAQELAGVRSRTPTQHHTMTTAYHFSKEKHVAALTKTLKSFTNPFEEESDDLFNLARKAVVLDER